MKAVNLKKEKRLDVVSDRSLNVQTYGKDNDYPQMVLEILSASTSGKSCVEVYRKFVNGKGFFDETLYNKVLNRKQQTGDSILSEIVKDYTYFGGFCLHMNYNLNFQITEIQHIPFETARYERLNDNNKFNHILIHPDWGKRDTLNAKWKKEDIRTFPLFNPKNVANEVLACGGIDYYSGQVFYFSNNGLGVYPLPIFDSALTDMSAQEGLSNVTYRNVRNNFFPACAMVEIAEKDQTEEQETQTSEAIKGIQSDEKLGKILYLQVPSREEIPEIIPFASKNYDKEFTESRKAVEQNIGSVFSQPPILRAQDVGSNFGSTAVKEAYNFYNSITEGDRFTISMNIAEILKYWYEPINVSTEIVPLTFNAKPTPQEISVELLSVMSVNEKRDLLGLEEEQDVKSDQSILAEKIGVGGVQAMVQITIDPLLTDEQKRGMLKLLFNLTDEDVTKILPI
jgi:hypothetical protein